MIFARIAPLLLCSVFGLLGCDLQPPGLTPAPTPTVVSAPTATSRPVLPTATPTPFGDVAFALPSPAPTVLPKWQRLKLFDDLWNTIDTNYVYTDFGGLDWTAIYQEFEPRAANAESALDFYGILAEMVVRLDDGHSAFYPPWQAEESWLITISPGGLEGLGIVSYPEDRSLVVHYVFANSPAERAGVARRDRITHINGQMLSDPAALPGRVSEPEGTSVRITIESPGLSPREVTLEQGIVINYIYPASIRLDADPSIAYLIIPTLNAEYMGRLVERELRGQLQAQPPLSGLVIDLRGNSGGWASVLTEILGNFLTGRVGTSLSVDNSFYHLIVEEGDLYDQLASIPIVVLVDSGTQSHAEHLAAILQAQAGSKVVGTRSRGNTEGVANYDFEDGSVLWLAVSSFKLSNGVNLEGRGVIPDVEVERVGDLARYEEAFFNRSVALIRQMNRR